MFTVLTQAVKEASDVSTTSTRGTRDTYHHGDLRAALITAATQLQEAGEPFSLRAVARLAGVSPTAPYRHFADRDALESALAVQGFADLTDALRAAGVATSVEDLGRLAVVYVDFALDRPALFKLMFGQPCDDRNDERVVAAARLGDLLSSALAGVFTDTAPGDLETLAVGAWGLVHGLAFLHLDGKLPATPRDAVAGRVRSAVAAVFAAQPASSSAS